MSILSAVTTKITPKAKHVVVYGVGGIGKTTFLADAVKKESGVMLLLGEDGLSSLGIEVPHIYIGGNCGDDMKKMAEVWDNFKDALKELMVSDHGYKFVGFDSLTSLVPHFDAWIIKNKFNGDSKAADAYGAKYSEYASEFAKIIESIKILNGKGITVMTTCHGAVSDFRDPSQENFKRWDIALPQGAKSNLATMLYNAADAVLFATYDITVGSDGKARGKRRIMNTNYEAAFQAKNRFNLPDRVLFDYDTLKETIIKSVTSTRKEETE